MSVCCPNFFLDTVVIYGFGVPLMKGPLVIECKIKDEVLGHNFKIVS